MYFKEYIDELGFIEQELYEFYKNKGYNAKLLYLNKTNIENEKSFGGGLLLGFTKMVSTLPGLKKGA